MFEDLVTQLERKVAEAPDYPAVEVAGRVALSYGDLWQRAGRLAAALQLLGIGRESVVGVALPKSADFLTVLLAIWRAAGAFLPLDPRLPAARLRGMATDARVDQIVCPQGDAPDWCENLPTTSLERLRASVAAGEEPSQERPLPEDLAYVVFTSGSSGRPKGVAVEHRGLPDLLAAQTEAFRLDRDARSLWLLQPAFDASLSDIGCAWRAGATLCLEPSLEDRRFAAGPLPQRVSDALRRREITHVDIPPALLAVLPEDSLPHLRTLIIGGEVCPPAVVRRWAERKRVVNVYGPTEATICSSLTECDPRTWERPLIGQPLTGVVYRVVDSRGTEVPLGEAGELQIGGNGVARGYVGQPELTAARFLTCDGTRFYRTGDRVRRTQDGEYAFLGRLDRQVKLHGHRIELEEIESALAAQPNVTRCAVIKRPLTSDGLSDGLVAYVTVACPVAPARLRQALADRLPDWMTPQRVEVLECLPELPGGKIDRAELGRRPPPHADAETEEEWQTDGERAVGSACRAVLGVTLGRCEPLETAGVNSLSLLELAAHAAAAGVTLPPSSWRAYQTIAEIGAQVALPPADRADALRAGDLRADIERERLPIAPTVGALPAPTAGEVFLTGATGFLGLRVLERWLQTSSAPVRCLVRASDDDAALRRLTDHAAREQIALPAERVKAVAGDLRRECFGLSPSAWDELTKTVSDVVHCGAQVDLRSDYAALRGVNVGGTATAITLAGTRRRKRLHYASSLSVFVSADPLAAVCREQDDLRNTETVYGGYAQTKWAAEVLVRNAGLPAEDVRIYRLGLLTSDRRTGRAAASDLLTLVIRGLVQRGVAPQGDPTWQIDMTPVDYAAHALVRLAQAAGPELTGERSHASSPLTFHLANPRSTPYGVLRDCLLEQRPALQQIENDRFMSCDPSLSSTENATPADAAAWLAFQRRLRGPDGEAFRTLDLFLATGVTFDQSITAPLLARWDVSPPAAGRQLARRVVADILAADILAMPASSQDGSP